MSVRDNRRLLTVSKIPFDASSNGQLLSVVGAVKEEYTFWTCGGGDGDATRRTEKDIDESKCWWLTSLDYT
ncbi:hypothetical protein PIB30_019119 [Stylosanthes scabra]|uniref:Uncharacterized protein n=1 Tax=Stylosanthes scabra TaxID=79078 RepID=A0ABU6WB89_9FABA|nr:hypothetical protein [Stylosanthes scabra]